MGEPFSRTGEVLDTGPSKFFCPHVFAVVCKAILARNMLLSDFVIRFLAESR